MSEARRSEAISRLFGHDAREEEGGQSLAFGLSQRFTKSSGSV